MRDIDQQAFDDGYNDRIDQSYKHTDHWKRVRAKDSYDAGQEQRTRDLLYNQAVERGKDFRERDRQEEERKKKALEWEVIVNSSRKLHEANMKELPYHQRRSFDINKDIRLPMSDSEYNISFFIFNIILQPLGIFMLFAVFPNGWPLGFVLAILLCAYHIYSEYFKDSKKTQPDRTQREDFKKWYKEMFNKDI